MAERTIVLDGFSKTYAMTGWRLGYAIVPDWLVKPYGRLIINTISGVTAFAQVGAVEALSGPQDAVDAMVARVPRPPRPGRRWPQRDPGHPLPTARRARSTSSRTSPGRASPARSWPTGCSTRPASRVLAGTAFGGVGTNHIRISYANSRENLHRSPRADPGVRRAARRGADGGRNRVLGGVTRPRVFVSRIIPEEGLAPIRAACDAEVWQDELPPPRDALLKAIEGCDGVLTLLTDRVDDGFLDRAGPQLKVVSNFAVGFDNVDVAACTKRRVAVGNTPGVLTETTADLAWALLMAAARRIAEGDRYVRDGQWRTWGPMLLMGPDVHGATLGIVGFGRIGQAVARRAKGFGMRILYHDPRRVSPAVEADMAPTSGRSRASCPRPTS